MTEPTSLDAFSRCEVCAEMGGAWNVLLPARRCLDHGGPSVPQYTSGTDDFEIRGFNDETM